MNDRPEEYPTPDAGSDQIADALSQAAQQALTAYNRGEWVDAERACRRVLSIRADNAPALKMLGMIAARLRRPHEAAEWLGLAIAVNPGDAATHNNRGVILQELQRFDEALESYQQALNILPGYSAALINRGITLRALRRFEEALQSYAEVLQINPDLAEAHYNRGNTLQDLNRFEEAQDSYRRALTLRPLHAEAHNNRGNALRALGRHEEALRCYQAALQSNPSLADALNNCGITLQELGRSGEALHSYRRALEISPGHAEAWKNLGDILQELGRPEEALHSYRRALEINRHYADACNNLGVTLSSLDRVEEALRNFDRALDINPGLAAAHNNRGNALQGLNRFEEALASLERALEIDPQCPWAYGTWLYLQMRRCNWQNLDRHLAELARRIENSVKTAAPFCVLALIDGLSLHRHAAETWINAKHPPSGLLPPLVNRGRHRKIRVGYFSADYRNHPVSILTAGVFERHDRSAFEISAFSYGPDTQDEMRQRLERAFDRFIDVRGRSDLDIAGLARSMELDIAVDLSGLTEYGRTGIFALRAAPLQVSYIGYLGTMGAAYIDYLIADPVIIPENLQRHYREKILYLPSYQANDSLRRIGEHLYAREELGLPPTAFVFCCCSSNYKFTPQVFDRWMSVLRRVPGSVLLLYAETAVARQNLSAEAQRRGIAPDRLVFCGRVPYPAYLARYRAADLFLDTLPYNGGATVSDALWAGLPVLTCAGEGFAARVAASLLTAVGLPELIATTPRQYEDTAVALASEPHRLAFLKDRLHRNRLSKPLFDTELFTRHLENGYRRIYERSQQGLGPEHTYVARRGSP